MRYNNSDLARAFVECKGRGSGQSHTDNFTWEDGRIFSYRMLLGVFHGDVLILCSASDSPSVTTSQHISCLQRAAWGTKTWRVPFNMLDALYLEPTDILSLRDWEIGDGSSLKFKDHWLHLVDSFNSDARIIDHHIRCVWRTAKYAAPDAILRTLMPTAVDKAAWDAQVWRFGDVFIVGLHDEFERGGSAPDHTIGYEEQSLTALARAKDDALAYCGMVRTDGHSFSPKHDGYPWFRIVPATVPSITAKNAQRGVFVPIP